MRSSLDELKQTEEHSAGVTDAAKPVRTRNPWRRRMIVGGVGCAAVLLVGTIIVVVQIRPDSDTPAEMVAGTEPEHGLEIPPVETSSPSACRFHALSERRANPSLRWKSRLDHHRPSLPDHHQPRRPLSRGWLQDVDEAKRIEPPLERKQTELGKQVERAIREGVRFPEGAAASHGSWSDVENEAKTGTTSLITLALLDCRREPGLAHDSQGARLPARFRHPTSCTAHTPSRCKRWSSPRPSPSAISCGSLTMSVGWNEPRSSPGDPVNWPGSWTYSNSKRGRPRRQLQHPVRAPGALRRQRGWSSRRSERLGAVARLLGENARSRTAVGPTLPTRQTRLPA